MPQQRPTSLLWEKPGKYEVIAVYLLYAGIVARTLTWTFIRHLLGWYLGLELLYLVLFSLVLWLPGIPSKFLHAYFAFQSVVTLVLFWLWPDFSFVVILFIPLCYQAALTLCGRARIVWIFVELFLLGVSMLYFQGVRGFAEGLVPMAGGFVIATYVIFSRQLRADRLQSQATLAELQKTNEKLKAYALQVEELAALEERNRLARELHDSVSQDLFTITLNTRAAQILLDRDPTRVRPQIELLQAQTQAALDEMRKFIIGLRPHNT